ncbi:hypothetical protein VDGE_30597 [Verticillium dahliae]|uniref:PNPLA domain-containing protein n=1 Tax=Verticillium dahliae TaxID=27337 RepID=A0A444RL99_VERDA|nr:hypothetical protein VDGE_30597 [Verticillium dahliae]
MILRNPMTTIDHDEPPKPCDYFDIIGGTSTDGPTAVALDLLRMSVDDCITAYASLSDDISDERSHRVKMSGQLRESFDSGLSSARFQYIRPRDEQENRRHRLPHELLLSSVDLPARLHHPLGGLSRNLGRTSFFDPADFGLFNERFIDSTLGANNPVAALWAQAKDVWGDSLQGGLRCLVSIGTGVPPLQPV